MLTIFSFVETRSSRDIPGELVVQIGRKEDRKEVLVSSLNEKIEKGDVLGVARVAGIMAAKRTGEFIPMCHPLLLTKVAVEFDFDEPASTVEILATVKCKGQTGVEMEALNGVSAALLNIWDMVKSLEKDETGNYPSTRIDEIKVLDKKKEPIQ